MASDKVRENVLFIHGFISSSSFWTETLFPNFSSRTKSSYRLLAVDLLGFGRSPKPTDSLYTLREHIEMIEKSVLEAHNLRSFHIVAHSLGCILALALAVRHPHSVKSLTLLAPVCPLTASLIFSIFIFLFSYNFIFSYIHSCFLNLFTAILSSTKGCITGHAVCDENDCATARLATHRVRRVDSLLVRAHNKDGVLAHLQEPPLVGISNQTFH